MSGKKQIGEAVRENRISLDLSSDVVVKTSDSNRNRFDFEAQLAEINLMYKYAPVGLALIDRSYRVIRINERMGAVCGLPADEIVGKIFAK